MLLRALDNNSESVLKEAQARFIHGIKKRYPCDLFLDFDQVRRRRSSDPPEPKRQKLDKRQISAKEKIEEIIEDYTNYGKDQNWMPYALNQIRGLVFTGLIEEFESDIAKLINQEDPEDVTPALQSLFKDVDKICDNYVNVIKENMPQSLMDLAVE